MNKSDSDLMHLSLVERGLVPVDAIDKADIVIFNTCSVRQHAEDRAISRIRSSRKAILKRQGITVVAGCMAQRIGNELVEKGIADIAVGTYRSPDIGSIIIQFLQKREESLYLSQDPDHFSKRIRPELAAVREKSWWHKWVTITHGCENFCSYCIVPSVRGRLISFPSDDILNYVQSLAGEGIREITLLGQNVNQYGSDSGDIPFYRLLERAAAVQGIQRVNFLTSHPKDFTADIVAVIRDSDNISRSIHLPLQSGSDRILRLMNRHYTLSHYMKCVDTINRVIGDYSISTDLIVGFPGESDEDFRETLHAVESIGFDDAFTYAYSPREGTPAFRLEETIARDEKMERLQILIQAQRKISTEKLMLRIDRVEDTIIERISKKSRNKVMGKTYLNHPVILPGTGDDIGKKFKVMISSVKGSTLQGSRIV